MFCLCIFWLKALGICLLGRKWKRSYLFVRILTFSMADMAMPQIVTWLQTPLGCKYCVLPFTSKPRIFMALWSQGLQHGSTNLLTCKTWTTLLFFCMFDAPTASGAVPLSISEFFWGSFGAPVVLGVLFGRPMRAHGDSFVPRS